MLVCIILLVLFLLLLLGRSYQYGCSRIRKLTGIEQDCYIELRGEKQFLQIRGENVNNPIILFLHGGPGISSSFLSYYYMKSFRENYTVVYWEQSGCGRTYYANTKKEITYQELLSDLDELVDYLCSRFHKQKIILLGHSSGTLLGTHYIKIHPEKIQAFLSISQVLNVKQAVIESTERVMNLYKKKERKSAHYLFALLSNIQNASKISAEGYVKYVTLINRIDSKLFPLSLLGKIKICWLVVSSPDLSILDIRWILLQVFSKKSFIKGYDSVIQEVAFTDLEERFGYDYEVPFYLIYGQNDYATPPDMITKFYNQLNAPKKNLIEIVDAGHDPFLDNRKAFWKSIRNMLEEL